MSFEECIAKVNGVTNLKDLFELWREAHECDDSLKETLPGSFELHYKLQKEFYKNFLPDGSLSSKKLTEHEILFICRESDSQNKEKKEELSLSIDKNNYWMKRVVQFKRGMSLAKETDDVKTKHATKYYNCMTALAGSLKYNKSCFEKGLATGSLDNCAYMNINKRGGYSQCDFRQLNGYARKYKRFIEKEIELLNPKKIVILGKLYEEELCKIFKDLKEVYSECKIYQYKRHPSRYWKWDKNFMKSTEVLLNQDIE